jgi:hypothetical protein
MGCLSWLWRRWCAFWNRSRPAAHGHTATPPQESPWCPQCNALLTQAIAEDDRKREAQ